MSSTEAGAHGGKPFVQITHRLGRVLMMIFKRVYLSTKYKLTLVRNYSTQSKEAMQFLKFTSCPWRLKEYVAKNNYIRIMEFKQNVLLCSPKT